MLLEHQVTAQEAGKKLSVLLRHSMGLSAALLKRLKAQNALIVDGLPVHADFRPQAGACISLDLGLTELPSDLIPEAGPLDIVFEDAYFLAVNKPAGLAVHPSRSKNTGSLANFAAFYLNGPVHIVNRLDRDTSGLVLLAKSAYAKSAGIQALHCAEKEYVGLVFNRFAPDKGRIDLPIARETQPGSMRRLVLPGGQPAATRYETLADFGTYSRVRFLLETGRTHQIRVHCAHLGHPILGDRLYGSEASQALSAALHISRQQLHAQSLSFTHPFSGVALHLFVPAPF